MFTDSGPDKHVSVLDIEYYCKTLVFGGHFTLALFAVKQNIAKFKKKTAKKSKSVKWAEISFQIPIQKYDIKQDLTFII